MLQTVVMSLKAGTDFYNWTNAGVFLEPMKDKVDHESSQSDENNGALNRSSATAIPPFNIPGKFAKYFPTIKLNLAYMYS